MVDIGDIASQVSSLAGIRKSKYYKKYEMIDKLLNSKKVPPQFKVMNLFLITVLLIMSIYSLIVNGGGE